MVDMSKNVAFMSCEKALKTVATYAFMRGQPYRKSRRRLHMEANLPQSAKTNS